MTENKIQTFYQQEAKIYDETRFKSSHGKFSDFVQQSAVKELIGNCKGKRILEIGSGTGRFTKELSKRGANVVCVDLSRQMHERSRSGIHDDGVQYFVMSGMDLGFACETFDVCLTINMMSHIQDERLILDEIKRVVKIGGLFVANFPNMAGFYFPVGVVVNLFNRSLQKPVYSRWYSVSAVFRLLICSGLDPVQVLAHLVFPVKRCPDFLFANLKKFDVMINSSWMRLLLGDLFIKCAVSARANEKRGFKYG